MKKLYLLLSFLLAFTFLTCEKEPEPEPEPEQPTLDERLIGGRWYYPATYNNTTGLTPKTSDGYYKFTEDSKFVYSIETTYYQKAAFKERDNLSGTIVYSKDGVVYFNEPRINLMTYAFHDKFPYPNSTVTDFYLTTDQRSVLSKIAFKGDLITYRIYKYDEQKLYSDSRLEERWFLVRFTDDGKPYSDYSH
jgi:hypothetical protein